MKSKDVFETFEANKEGKKGYERTETEKRTKKYPFQQSETGYRPKLFCCNKKYIQERHENEKMNELGFADQRTPGCNARCRRRERPRVLCKKAKGTVIW